MLCESIVIRFVYDNKLIDNHNYYLNYKNEKHAKALISHISKSTCLGIALVELGVITKENNPQEYQYISERSGILIEHYDYDTKENNFLTLREVLEMLPDSLEKDTPITDINSM